MRESRDGAHRVGPAKVFEQAEGIARLRLEQRVVRPGGGVAAVEGLGDDVVVAAKDDRLLQRQPVFEPGFQPRIWAEAAVCGIPDDVLFFAADAPSEN